MPAKPQDTSYGVLERTAAVYSNASRAQDHPGGRWGPWTKHEIVKRRKKIKPPPNIVKWSKYTHRWQCWLKITWWFQRHCWRESEINGDSKVTLCCLVTYTYKGYPMLLDYTDAQCTKITFKVLQQHCERNELRLKFSAFFEPFLPLEKLFRSLKLCLYSKLCNK